MGVIWYVIFLLLTGLLLSAALIAAELLDRTESSQNPLPAATIRSIEQGACLTMDLVSEEYLRQIEKLFRSQKVRRRFHGQEEG